METQSSGNNRGNGRKKRIKTLKTRLEQIKAQVRALTEFDARKQTYKQISQEIAFYEKYVSYLNPEEEKTWYEAVDEISDKITEVISSLVKVSKEENQTEQELKVAKSHKLLAELEQSKKNFRFSRFVTIIEAFGFRLSRVKGSHHIFKREDVRENVNVQDKKGKAKAYQIDQFFKLVSKYDLRAEE